MVKGYQQGKNHDLQSTKSDFFYWIYIKIDMVLKYFRYYVESIFQQMHIVQLQVTQRIYLWSNEWINQVMYSNIKASVLNDYVV